MKYVNFDVLLIGGVPIQTELKRMHSDFALKVTEQLRMSTNVLKSVCGRAHRSAAFFAYSHLYAIAQILEYAAAVGSVYKTFVGV